MLGLVSRNQPYGLSLFDDFTNLFQDMLQPFTQTKTGFSLPSLDIYSEDDRNMIVEMQAPGFDRDDIEISTKNGVLEIRGERTEKEEQKDKKRSYMVRENSTSFYRRIALPEGADTEKIGAQLDRGVLRVTVPVERAEAKRIEIATPNKKNRARLTSLTGSKSETK